MKTNKIYFFTAPWCSACKALKPNFIKWAEDNNVSYELIDVESDSSIELVEKNKIRNLPTLVFVDAEDNVIGRETGNVQVNILEKYL